MSAMRFPTFEKAAIEVYGRAEAFKAELKNLSLTGAMFEWSEDKVPLKKGDLVRVTVNLKSLNRKHNLNAEVIWADGNRTGVNFIKSEELIEKMMERG